MAATSHRLIASTAACAGRLVAAYSRAVVKPASTEMIAEAPLPRAPSVWISWHECNLITLALHRQVTGRNAMAFVPPGLSGAAMGGWLTGLKVTPIPLAADARRGLALRQMEAALAAGNDVLIAVDGPRGPRHRIAPGAMWLACATDVEVRPVGCAAWPALRLPRWDRLILPLPGARIVMVTGAPLAFRSPSRRSDEATAYVAANLRRLTALAGEAASAEHGLRPKEALPWR
jgi:lysophospholipid acyltransferase (LPLAT)-like uncharacterized protein